MKYENENYFNIVLKIAEKHLTNMIINFTTQIIVYNVLFFYCE